MSFILSFNYFLGVVPERRLAGHRQEVCGLKWSPDGQYLASGGNDNRLHVWSHHTTSSKKVDKR